MAAMARPSANCRLFVAIYPPLEVATAALKALQRLELPPHRASPPEQVHLTVQFIGDTPMADLDHTMESVRRAAAGLAAFDMSLVRLMALPERGPARLVAAEADAHPTLLELHRRLVTRLARNVRRRDRERFLPHFTLARFRAPTHGAPAAEPLALGPFLVQRLSLMRSTLGPAGAAHHELLDCELQAPEGR